MREDVVYVDGDGSVHALEHGGRKKLSETMRLLIATWICLERLQEDQPEYFKLIVDSVKDKATGKTLKQTVNAHIRTETGR